MRILTSSQEQFLNFFKSSELSRYFYFTGGTALSQFYLQHRYSYDLDFFTEEKNALEIDKILSFLHSLPDTKEIKYEKIYDRRLFFLKLTGEDIKVEFSLYPFKRIVKSKRIDGLTIDSFGDLFVNKLMALSDRDEEKDLIDIYFILKDKGNDYILWGLEKVKEKFQVDGVQYIIQRKFMDLPKNLENMPYLIKPITNYREFFKNIAVKLAKEYWNT